MRTLAAYPRPLDDGEAATWQATSEELLERLCGQLHDDAGPRLEITAPRACLSQRRPISVRQSVRQ